MDLLRPNVEQAVGAAKFFLPARTIRLIPTYTVVLHVLIAQLPNRYWDTVVAWPGPFTESPRLPAVPRRAPGRTRRGQSSSTSRVRCSPVDGIIQTELSALVLISVQPAWAVVGWMATGAMLTGSRPP
jgi:hypothetical protein